MTKSSCVTVKKWAYTENVCYLNLANSLNYYILLAQYLRKKKKL